jgi:hypothetical protein
MTVKELENELDKVELAVSRLHEAKDMYGLIARGVWQVALQLAKLNEGVDRVQQ